MGVFGVHGGGAEFLHLIPVHQGTDVFVVDDADFLHFVRGAEAVEEMAEGQAGVNGRKVGHQGEVHGFLHRSGAQKAEARLPGGHDVLVVAKDGQGVRGQGARRHMEDAGQKLARNFVHVGYHQQQALRGRIGGRERATRKHAVHHAGRAGLGLHFAYDDRLSQQVFLSLGGHFVHDLAHDGRGGDGINGCRFRQGVGNVRGGVIAVHGFHVSHLFLLGAPAGRVLFPVGRGSRQAPQSAPRGRG